MTAVNVTRNAWNKMNSVMKSSHNKFGFLFSASAGGCNGFNFNLNLLDETTYKELSNTKFINVLSHENATLFVDPFSELYLLGTTIDYVTEDIQNGSFDNKFVYNIDKKIATSCGCGISFMPRDIRE